MLNHYLKIAFIGDYSLSVYCFKFGFCYQLESSKLSFPQFSIIRLFIDNVSFHKLFSVYPSRVLAVILDKSGEILEEVPIPKFL